MPRAATTSDVFNAIAETRRRQIVELLAGRGALAVGAIALAAGLRQPAVSKHLAVLHEVGIVSATRDGRQRVYRLDADGLKDVHTWVSQFERLWSHQLGRIKQRAERAARAAREAARVAARAAAPSAPQPKGKP
jgi:DNA-binding transcriptional ArsR family regulator